jgi:hypothetical protein
MMDKETRTFFGTIFFILLIGILGSFFGTRYIPQDKGNSITFICWLLAFILGDTNVWRNVRPGLFSEFGFFISLTLPFLMGAIFGTDFVYGISAYSIIIVIFTVVIWLIPYWLKEKSHQIVQNANSKNTGLGKALWILVILLASFGFPLSTLIGKYASQANDGGWMYMLFFGFSNLLIAVTFSILASFYLYTKYHPKIE